MKLKVSEIRVGNTVRHSDTYDTCTFTVEEIKVTFLKNGKARVKLMGTSIVDRRNYNFKRTIFKNDLGQDCFRFATRDLNEDTLTQYINHIK